MPQAAGDMRRRKILSAHGLAGALPHGLGSEAHETGFAGKGGVRDGCVYLE